ncbi:surfactant protein Bb [Myxocyprinus asiaticus]|uniref:surfactant protein Bb n=1 Tax=Myxocyprinus asiaticus TaxID=70543 RepID=UPI002221FE93|nr:surfactant protein Bb [Myxocyprinus asiaticus]
MQTMEFAILSLFVFTSTLSSGWARRVEIDLHRTTPQTSSPPMMNNMCSDCNRIVLSLREMLSNQDSQHLNEEALNKFCYEFPTMLWCTDGANKYRHLVIQYFGELANHKEGDICSLLGLCSIRSERKVLTVGLNESGFLYAKPFRGTSEEVHVNPICTFCLFLIKTLENMLPKERTEEAIVKLLEKICDYLPAQYKDTCDRFIETYGKKIIDLLISSAPPHTICTLLGLCLFPETPILLPTVQTDCDSCKILAVLSQLHLGHNITEIQTSALLQKICHLHPNAIPQCDGFVKIHGLRVLKNQAKQPAITACQEDYLCKGRN